MDKTKVYQETKPTELYHLLKEWIEYRFATQERAETMTEYNFPHPMIDPAKIRGGFGGFLDEYGYEIAKRCYHENNIGNNNQYPIYMDDNKNKMLVGHLYICLDFAGNAFVCILTAHGKRRGTAFRVRYDGYRIEY